MDASNEDSAAAATLDGLLLLVEHRIININTFFLYVYIRRHTGERMTLPSIVNGTTLSATIVQKNIKALELLKIVERSDRSAQGYVFDTYDLSSNMVSPCIIYTPTPSSSSKSKNKRVASVSRVASIYGKIRKVLSKSLADGDTVLPYAKDEDWIVARKILLTHFPKFNVDYRISSKRFLMRLCLLVTDGELNAYCRWYKDQGLWLGWGLFLIPRMIDRFHSEHEEFEASQAHLHTSSKEMKAKHAIGAKKTKAWIEEHIPKGGE